MHQLLEFVRPVNMLERVLGMCAPGSLMKKRWLHMRQQSCFAICKSIRLMRGSLQSAHRATATRACGTATMIDLCSYHYNVVATATASYNWWLCMVAIVKLTIATMQLVIACAKMHSLRTAAQRQDCSCSNQRHGTRHTHESTWGSARAKTLNPERGPHPEAGAAARRRSVSRDARVTRGLWRNTQHKTHSKETQAWWRLTRSTRSEWAQQQRCTARDIASGHRAFTPRRAAKSYSRAQQHCQRGGDEKQRAQASWRTAAAAATGPMRASALFGSVTLVAATSARQAAQA